MSESHPIPALAQIAYALALEANTDAVQRAQRQLKTRADQISAEAVKALGLDPEGRWMVDYTKGTISRDTTEAPMKVSGK